LAGFSSISPWNGWFLGILGTTAVAAAIALLFPPAVAFGLILGVLPGIFLSLAPSLFMYLLGWRITRWVVLRVLVSAGFSQTTPRNRWLAGFAALVIVAIPAIAIPLVINAPLQQEIAMLQATDVAPAGSVKLSATVGIELPKSFGNKAPYCEAICLRLLYNGAVSSVVSAELLPNGKLKKASGYRIERHDECSKPDLPNSLIVWPGEWRAVRGERPISIMDRVRARISAGECLVRQEGHLEDAEVNISVRGIKRGLGRFDGPRKLWLDTVSARRLEIIGSDGRVLYRLTEVTAQPLAVPLLYVVAAGFLTTVTYSGWMRSNMEVSPLGPDARDVLPDLLGDASRPPDLPGVSPRM
jgi:hypothetical protein